MTAAGALSQAFYILVFPGFLVLAVFSMVMEYVDRKLHAKLQNRVGPPWFQPFADFIKLAAKEEIVPRDADATIFKYMPVVALTSTVTALFYIPVWSTSAPCRFEGDMIVTLYFLTIPTVTFFLAGWYSRSVFSMLGAARAILQMFAYEIPLFLSILAPALLANTWSMSSLTEYYRAHPLHILFNLPGFAIALVALLGKLERVPFDIPEAETEIVAGSFTEYSGRFLALFRLTVNVEAIVGATLLAAVFMPFGLGHGPAIGFAGYLVKVLLIVVLLAIARTVLARLRIDQMINFCWQIAAPIAFLQVLVNLVVKEILM